MRTTHTCFRIATGLALCALATGCGDDTGSSTELDGREFLLESAEGFEPVAGTTLRVTFRDGQVGFHAGCNHHSGPYALRDGALIVDGLGSTEIGCEAPLHAQDEWLADFMASSPALDLDGDKLTLTGSDATLRLLDRELADPDRELAGVLWSIDTFITGDAASNLPLDSDPTLEFDADGSLRVDTTCSIDTGRYAVGGDTVTLSDMSHDGLSCAGAAAMAASHIRLVMGNGEVRFEIEANRLTLTRSDLGLSATTP